MAFIRMFCRCWRTLVAFKYTDCFVHRFVSYYYFVTGKQVHLKLPFLSTQIFWKMTLQRSYSFIFFKTYLVCFALKKRHLLITLISVRPRSYLLNKRMPLRNTITTCLFMFVLSNDYIVHWLMSSYPFSADI